jgi:magnesium-transporting ATPase (P-type)
MGIRCIMLTGDKREVAEWVAQEIGLRALPLRRNGCITMFWQLRSPTSWCASLGRSWRSKRNYEARVIA